jgi:hypothetical protein
MPKNKAQVSSAPARRKVSQLLAQGRTPRAIATLMGVTTQRVYKVMADLRAEAKEREEAS